MPFWVGVTLLEQGELLCASGRAGQGEPYLAEAAGIFEHLRAEPWLRRARRARTADERVHS